MTVKEIRSKSEFDSLLASGKVVFVDFYANWCGPCRQISPIFQDLAAKNAQEGVEYYKLNIDELEDVSQEVGISSIPAFHVYQNGARIGEVIGADRSGLTNLVQTHGRV